MKPVLKLNIKIERIVIYENRSSMRKWKSLKISCKGSNEKRT